MSTYEEKLALAAECRAGTALETGLPPDDLGSVTATRVNHYLPGGEAKSVVPIKPALDEPLEHLNPKWRTRPGKRRKA